MGCWIKSYKKGYGWFCNCTCRRISPIYGSYRDALKANIFSERVENFGFETDARVVSRWVKKKELEKISMTDDKLTDFYGPRVVESKPW